MLGSLVRDTPSRKRRTSHWISDAQQSELTSRSTAVTWSQRGTCWALRLTAVCSIINLNVQGGSAQSIFAFGVSMESYARTT